MWIDRQVAAAWGATLINHNLPFFGRLQIIGFATVEFNEAPVFAAICLTDSGKEMQLFAWSVRMACEKVFPVLDWEDMIGKKIRIAKRGVAATIIAIP